MGALHAYTCAAMPHWTLASPLPPNVIKPSTKSVGSLGIGTGFHLSWVGVAGNSSNGVLRRNRLSIRLNGRLWAAEGRIRYTQVRRFSDRGAVNAVPERS